MSYWNIPHISELSAIKRFGGVVKFHRCHYDAALSRIRYCARSMLDQWLMLLGLTVNTCLYYFGINGVKPTKDSPACRSQASTASSELCWHEHAPSICKVSTTRTRQQAGDDELHPPNEHQPQCFSLDLLYHANAGVFLICLLSHYSFSLSFLPRRY